MDNSPLLSIAIASKNREKYCIQVIETILKYKEDFELVIQDNSDSQYLKDYVEKNFNDSRLIYNYTPPPFSSIDNFNAVLELCSGKYVCLIGDDDGILSNIFDVVKWANINNYDSVLPKKFINYIWPSDSSNGRLLIRHNSYKIEKNIPLQNIQALINDGVILYTKFNLPKLYHGIIKRECLNKLKEKTGYYLGGLSPDIYASVALSSVVQNQFVVDFPISIAGACPKSTTVDNIKGGHSGKLENAPHLRSKPDYQWEKLVPKFYSVQTIWADSGIKAIKEHKIHVDLDRLNRLKIYAAALNDSLDFKDTFKVETLKVLNQKSFALNQNFKIIYYRILLFLSNILKRIPNLFPKNPLFKNYKFSAVKNIEEATKISNEIIGNFEYNKKLRKD